MSTNKYIDKVCCAVVVLSLMITILFMNAAPSGSADTVEEKGYEARLFDTEMVHKIEIVMDDWEGFLDNCTDEAYRLCSIVIDGEVCKNAGIRAKGNTSLKNVADYGNNRYSFKIEFDHYDSAGHYYGLDKLCLNNIIQDHTYMKDFLTYQMMRKFGVDAPLCSYANITVNGAKWGLYLAVEGVEESFLSRNYGEDYGKLYKPDSENMGGGRGNGKTFSMAEWKAEDKEKEAPQMRGGEAPQMRDGEAPQMRDGEALQMPDGEAPQMPDGEAPQPPYGEAPQMRDGEAPQMPDGEAPQPPDGTAPQPPEHDAGGMGSEDVKLVYSDDAYESYANIFDHAKTDITNADKDRLIGALKNLKESRDLEEILDTDEVIRYFVVHNFVCNFDSYTGSMVHNYYLYEEQGQLSMIPWDYNLAFGGFQDVRDAGTLVNYPIDAPVSGGTVEDRPMLAWIFDNETYTEQYHIRFSEFISDYFESGYFSEMMDEVKEMIAPFVEKDVTKFCTYEEFEKGIDTLKTFCLLRAESVTGQLAGRIASDSEKQEQGSWIEAADLDISAMGGMGGRR